MSEYMVTAPGDGQSVIYAIDPNTSPPSTCIISWSTGSEEAVDTSLPPGFVEVTGPEYNQAKAAGQRALERSQAQGVYDQRVMLSSRRNALVNTGMTYEQACIIVPDPIGDYSIDDGWRS